MGDANSKSSFSLFSLNDFKYLVVTISLPKGKKLYLIIGHKKGKRGKKIIPPNKYNKGTYQDVNIQIILARKDIKLIDILFS